MSLAEAAVVGLLSCLLLALMFLASRPLAELAFLVFWPGRAFPLRTSVASSFWISNSPHCNANSKGFDTQ
jgi:hypothetical protein